MCDTKRISIVADRKHDSTYLDEISSGLARMNGSVFDKMLPVDDNGSDGGHDFNGLASQK